MLAAFAQGVPRLWEKIIHRSLIPERNWVRGPGAQLDDGAQIFQAVLDLFCWKHYLWATTRDSFDLQFCG